MSFLTASAHRNVYIFFCLVVSFDKKSLPQGETGKLNTVLKHLIWVCVVSECVFGVWCS